MSSDQIYKSLAYKPSEIEHRYGQRIHILSDPFLLSHLSKLCARETFQPTINELVEKIYSNLVQIVVNAEFPRKLSKTVTRMADYHPNEAVVEADLPDVEQSAISVNLARAGTLPSYVVYHSLNYILNPCKVRQDHISINRATNQNQEVVGVNVAGHKIGGSIENAVVLFPDPMGATGSTIINALDIYKKQVEGRAQKFIALHLIVTPEYLMAVQKAHPDLSVYAVRLDRGLSNREVLNSIPGTFWDKERGLNQKQYIVPGGGGFGEILNNSFV